MIDIAKNILTLPEGKSLNGKLLDAISDTKISQLKASDKCPEGHNLKVIGYSCCDDICKCECGEWFRCGLGSMWKKQ